MLGKSDSPLKCTLDERLMQISSSVIDTNIRSRMKPGVVDRTAWRSPKRSDRAVDQGFHSGRFPNHRLTSRSATAMPPGR